MERYKNISLGFLLLAFVSISAGVGLREIASNALVISIGVATVLFIIAIFFFRKAKKAG